MTPKPFIALTLLALAAGCMPRVTVKPNPAPDAPGIRYYRPKPYLLITPFTEITTKDDVKITGLTDQYVQLELQMLPDFSEEYAITIHSGFGTNNTQITLEDGWNLTQLNADLDSKTAENIKAVGELISSVGGLAVGRTKTADGDTDVPCKPVVRATNVPLGYYESVIGRDPCGKKQLYGWRYVGFAPFNGCPLQMCGAQAAPCGAIPLYGLAFQDGIMTFKLIQCLEAVGQSGNYRCAQNPAACPTPVSSPPPCAAILPGPPLPQPRLAATASLAPAQ